MNDQITRSTLFGRIGSLFRRGIREIELTRSEIPSLLEQVRDEDEMVETPAPLDEHVDGAEPRTTFLRPWVKRDQAIDQLQNGVAALSDLMDTISQTLQKQSTRQDELLNYLSHLPEALQSLPENGRVQGEALKGIQASIQQQNTQQNKLADVLERMNRDGDENGRTLESVRERVDMIAMHEEAIGQSLTSVGIALQTVGTTAESSAKILENLGENLITRDSDLERVIRRQNTRFTTMLTVAIVMSMAALTAVVVFGYLGYETLSHMAK